MWFSVGQLYSSQRLLEWIASGEVRTTEIETSQIGAVLVCPASDVLSVVFKGSWAMVDVDGVLQLTPRGKVILGLSDAAVCLCEQLRDLISCEKPPWSKLISRGRKELIRTAPAEVSQMLLEAGLLVQPPSEQVVRWWDEMAEIARGLRAADLLETGRKGERLTLAYESARTKVEPVWQSIESNMSGFDVLSVLANGDRTPLRIEVKASGRNINAAEFTVTRNEWTTAMTTGNYVFHLWQIFEGMRRLAIISAEQLQDHVPKDKGGGEWQQVRIPFRSFRELFVAV